MRLRRIVLPIVFVVFAAVLAACGSSGSSASTGSQNPSANQLQAVFASFDLAPGPPSRVLFGVQLGNGRFIGFGTIDVTLQPPDGNGTPIHSHGSYLPVPGTTLPDPLPTQPQIVNAALRGVYELPPVQLTPGIWNATVVADVKDMGRMVASTSVQVAKTHSAVAVGMKAPASNNPTISQHGNLPLAAVDSRAQNSGSVPDPILHQKKIKDSLAAHRPMVIIVATPVYCTSRFCGPTTDLVAKLAKQYNKQADFIDVEVWANYDKQQLNQAAADWIARGQGDGNEPWVFIVGSDGIVKARFGNLVSEKELVTAIEQYAK